MASTDQNSGPGWTPDDPANWPTVPEGIPAEPVHAEDVDAAKLMRQIRQALPWYQPGEDDQ